MRSNNFLSTCYSIESPEIRSLLLLRCGDVEQNPGPGPRPSRGPGSDASSTEGKDFSLAADLQVTTYNIRGLNDENKMRHLLNNFNKNLKKNSDSIICLQETYIEELGKMPYIWRGNVHFTPGLGNSCGFLVVTLM